MRTSTLSILIVASASCSALAEVHEIQQSGFDFIPSTVTVNPGDTIRWIRGSGSHTINHGDCSLAEDPLFSSLPLNASNPIAEWTVPAGVNRIVPFYCDVSTHCAQFGMFGEIIVEPDPDSTIHEVTQVGTTFVPETITAAPGDTVRWTWNGGGHTVTSGDRDTCKEDGLFFDMPLDAGNSVAIWEVPEDMPASVDYICTFHCEQGHVGTINRPLPGDFDGNGCIDGADLTELLGCWGTSCGDINGDGTTDGSDLSTLLGFWGCG